MVLEVVEEVRDLSRLYNLLIGMGILDTDLHTVIILHRWPLLVARL